MNNFYKINKCLINFNDRLVVQAKIKYTIYIFFIIVYFFRNINYSFCFHFLFCIMKLIIILQGKWHL